MRADTISGCLVARTSQIAVNIDVYDVTLTIPIQLTKRRRQYITSAISKSKTSDSVNKKMFHRIYLDA